MLARKTFGDKRTLFACIFTTCSFIIVSHPLQAETVRATPAYNVVNAIGINTHFGYDGSIYDKRFGELKAAINELGIRRVRDTVNQLSGLARIRDLYNSYGVKMLATIDARNAAFRANIAGIDPKLNMLTTGLPTAAISAIESINEPNVQNRGNGYPGWVTDTRAYQQALASKVRARTALKALPILAPSFAYPTQSPAYAQVGNLSAWATANNAHPYPNWLTFENDTEIVMPWVTVSVPGAPVYFTESGWHTAMNSNTQPLDEKSRAKNMPRAILYTAIQPRLKSTYFYQLVDDQPNPELTKINYHYGLLNYYMQKTPQYYAVRNTMRLFCDNPLTFGAQTLSYHFTGDMNNVKTALFQKNSHSFLLAVWLNAQSWSHVGPGPVYVPPHAIRVTFDQPMQAARMYRPGDPNRDLTNGDMPIYTANTPTYLDLSIADQVTVLEVTVRGVGLPPVNRACSYRPS